MDLFLSSSFAIISRLSKSNFPCPRTDVYVRLRKARGGESREPPVASSLYLPQTCMAYRVVRKIESYSVLFDFRLSFQFQMMPKKANPVKIRQPFVNLVVCVRVYVRPVNVYVHAFKHYFISKSAPLFDVFRIRAHRVLTAGVCSNAGSVQK